MADLKVETKIHPTEVELSDLLSGSLSGKEKERVEAHIASCGECLNTVVSAYESVKMAGKNRKGTIMKKINIYLVLSIIAFLLSFAMPGHFVQFLVATLLLGIKWVADSKSTKMLIMIYEAWKKGGEKEASRVLETLDSSKKNRF